MQRRDSRPWRFSDRLGLPIPNAFETSSWAGMPSVKHSTWLNRHLSPHQDDARFDAMFAAQHHALGFRVAACAGSGVAI
jgi:hypothetical protein